MGRVPTEVGRNERSGWLRMPLGAGALTMMLVLAAGVGSGRSLAHVGGPSQVVNPRSYGADVGVILLAIVVFALAGAVYALGRLRRRRRNADEPEAMLEWEHDGRWLAWLSLLALVAAAAAFIALVSHFSHGPQTPASNLPRPVGIGGNGSNSHPGHPVAGGGSSMDVHWWALLAAAVFLVGGALLAWSLTRRRAIGFGKETAATSALRTAVDLSVADIEREPDPRLAVIKAYGRMETALGSHGIARRPFETPLEYLARSLVSLRVSRGSAKRLTSLFERAKFSQHRVDSSMKRDAVEALITVRDDLRVVDR